VRTQQLWQLGDIHRDPARFKITIIPTITGITTPITPAIIIIIATITGTTSV